MLFSELVSFLNPTKKTPAITESPQRSSLLYAGASVLFATGLVHAAVDYDRHVFFENSLPDRSYNQSEGMVVAPSQLDLADGKVPVESQHFMSPPNGLRLKWKSASGGEWRIKLKSMARYGRNLEFEGDTLSVWCFSEKPMSPDESPRINLQDRSGTGSGTTTLLASNGPLPGGKWVRLNIPLSSFKNLYPSTEDLKFDARKLESIWFVQGLDDGQEHTLYLDDFRIVWHDRVDSEPPAAPAGLAVKGFEHHFDLTWQANHEDDLLTYKIYRSADGGKYVPVGVQRNHLNRTVDFDGKPGSKATYRISALDLSGNESPLSTAVSATTRPFKDEELLEMVQEACFRYYWEGGHPNAGMAIEILPGDENLVAVGASGFGIMALIVGAERQFVTRDQCAERLLKIVRFLDKADRFHGVWPHFLDGKTGKITPYFGKYDNGGDLVETAFLVQGLLAARQYFDRDSEPEREIRQTITKLWREVEWDWYRKEPSSEFLYWHWSPDHGWYLSHPLVGWNETMIVYLLAIASPTHAVPASLYHSGWAGQSDLAVRYRQNWSRTTQGDHYTNGNSYYGFKIEVGEGSGADLFFTQFSFMGFDPREKKDRYTNYYLNNRNIARINHAYCADNPRKHLGYGADCWGLSAGINSGGGRPLSRDDNGTICISAALGSFPYTPKESMAALKHFYRDLGDKAYGIYGFHDGFNQTQNWFEGVWMGLNQGTITVMIENYRTGLVWSKFMANPEIQPALEAIGFTPDRDSNTR
jgi:exo beta-1,2-glucooligosaccharide sophorohydrolase (non-reducing end)